MKKIIITAIILCLALGAAYNSLADTSAFILTASKVLSLWHTNGSTCTGYMKGDTTCDAGASPAGVNADIQFNSNGAFAVDTGLFTYNGQTHTLGVGVGGINAAKTSGVPGYIVLYDDYPTELYGMGWMGPHAASARGATTYLQLPDTDPSGGQVLSCATPVSGVSTCSWVSMSTTTVPGAPTSVSVASSNQQNIVSWGIPLTGNAPTSYNLYWSTSSMGGNIVNGTKVTNVSSPDIIGSLSNGTTYDYIITAVNSAGEGAGSAEVSGTPTATVTAQNYNNYTAVGSGFTVASSTDITFSNIANSANAYIYKDFGAGYFGTQFTHYFDVNISAMSGTLPVLILWEVANTVGNDTSNKATGGLNFAVESGNGFYLNEEVSGTVYSSSSYTFTSGTSYYISIVRNSTALNAYIYDTSAHRLAGGSTGLLSTLSLTLHNSTTWEYLYAATTWDGSYSGVESGSVQNLTIVH